MSESPPEQLQENQLKDDSSDREYQRAVKLVLAFREELITLFHKAQESFEKQLSFISAGSLALSVGFIKDIVKPFEKSSYKWLLGFGWGLLVATLLLNCISHMLAAQYANKAIKEINEQNYDPVLVRSRNRRIVMINWITIGSMIIGIALILYYIIYNSIIHPYAI